jgi:FkbM family methyltransferase
MRYAGQNLVYIREDSVDGVGPWVWAKSDIHAWIGPKNDWELGHKAKILHYVPEDKRRVVIQAGGNMGMYPRLLSDMFQSVYTFEPDPVNFHCLVANCQRDNIIKMNAALGLQHEMVSISVERFVDWETNYGVRDVVKKENSHIPTFMIDDLKPDYCDLIMLDVEGYELNILKGANKTIEKFHPVIFAEYAEPCIPYLQSFGYEAVDRSYGDIIFVRTK